MHHCLPILRVSFSPTNPELLASSSMDGTVYVYKVTRGNDAVVKTVASAVAGGAGACGGAPEPASRSVMMTGRQVAGCLLVDSCI
jgi:WD40 repeat protein